MTQKVSGRNRHTTVPHYWFSSITRMVPHSSYLALSPLTLPLAALTTYTHSALSKVIVPLLLTPRLLKFSSTSSIQLNRDLPLFPLPPLCLPLTSLLSPSPLLLLLLLLLSSTYTLQPSRLIVRSGLDVPTLATRRLHACHHARAPRGGLWARNVL